MVTKAAIDQVPSLPQVLVQILDAIHSHNANYQSIAEIIRHDSGVAARLVSVANSSFYGRGKSCETIERALLMLGTDVVKTIAITASIKQFFGQFNQDHAQFLRLFWRRSLITANLAQVLATLTSYSSPDEAYLCGLLTDLGQLVLLTNHESEYLALLATSSNDKALAAAEEQQLGQSHAQLGAQLIDSWNIEGFMADAVLYHHEPNTQVQDAHHLVKIINLASQLSAPGNISDSAIEAADQLFGLNESLTLELRSRINADVDNMAQGLNIDIRDPEHKDIQHARQVLGDRLSDIGELAEIKSTLLQAQSLESLQQAAQRALFLTLGIESSILFLTDHQHQRLYSQLSPEATDDDGSADFFAPMEAGRSLVSDACLSGEIQSGDGSENPLCVLDRQLQRLCGGGPLLCWPLIQPSTGSVGVLVFTPNQEQQQRLASKTLMVDQLRSQIAAAISNCQQQLSTLAESDQSTDQQQLRIREAVHEASNPLSIIRNYLETLRIKLGDEHSANDGLNLIKEEIDRVGNILLRLRDPDQNSGDSSALDINQVIRATSHIFQDSICATREHSIQLELDEQVNPISGNTEHLKQILTNLIKNAVEAMASGGTITISSEAGVSVSGKDYVGINVRDTGPGIALDIKRRLFTPVTSTKGDGHSGLGLSIVKKLIDDMDGSIVCRSKEGQGTLFEILLPVQ